MVELFVLRWCLDLLIRLILLYCLWFGLGVGCVLWVCVLGGYLVLFVVLGGFGWLVVWVGFVCL